MASLADISLAYEVSKGSERTEIAVDPISRLAAATTSAGPRLRGQISCKARPAGHRASVSAIHPCRKGPRSAKLDAITVCFRKAMRKSMEPTRGILGIVQLD
jgi:hypothetical protein